MTTNRLQLYEYAGGKCVFCGNSIADALARFHTAKGQFEFNHIRPERKHPDYDALIRRRLSTEVLNEVDKCKLFCRNCHGLFQGQNVTGRVVRTLKLGGFRRRQTSRTRAIIDYRPKHIVMFSDDKDKLELFSVQLLGQKPFLRILRDLECDLFSVFIPATKQCGSLLIRDANRTPLIQVKRLNSEHYEMEIDVRCPILELELHGEPGEPVVWIRNGAALTLDGEVLRQGVVSLHNLSYADCPKP